MSLIVIQAEDVKNWQKPDDGTPFEASCRYMIQFLNGEHGLVRHLMESEVQLLKTETELFLVAKPMPGSSYEEAADVIHTLRAVLSLGLGLPYRSICPRDLGSPCGYRRLNLRELDLSSLAI